MIKIVKWTLVGMGLLIALIGLFFFPEMVGGDETKKEEDQPKKETEPLIKTPTV